MNRMARVIQITPRQPFGADPPESPAERAAHSALNDVAEFYLVLSQIGTVDEALRLERIATQLSEHFGHVARSALLKADALCDGSRQ